MAIFENFHDIRLDSGNCRSATGGITYRTEVIGSQTGGEQRNSRWPSPRASWVIQYVVKSNQEKFKKLNAFFRNRKGKFYGFRFKDWMDFEDDGEGYIEEVNGVIRLTKHYDDGEYVDKRVILFPVMDTLDLSAGATFDPDTGIATLGGTNRWTGDFDIPVRFMNDKMNVNYTPDMVVDWNGVGLIELVKG